MRRFKERNRSRKQSRSKLYGNSSYIFWVYQFELKVILFERYWHVCKKKIWNKMSVSFFFLPQSKNYLNVLFTDAQPGRIHSSIKKRENIDLEIIVFLFVNIANNNMYGCDLTCIHFKGLRQSVLPSF